MEVSSGTRSVVLGTRLTAFFNTYLGKFAKRYEHVSLQKTLCVVLTLCAPLNAVAACVVDADVQMRLHAATQHVTS